MLWDCPYQAPSGYCPLCQQVRWHAMMKTMPTRQATCQTLCRRSAAAGLASTVGSAAPAVPLRAALSAGEQNTSLPCCCMLLGTPQLSVHLGS